MPTDIRRKLKKFIPILLKAREDNLNEADTAQRIIKLFEEVFEYDGISEITQETKIKGKYVDIAIKIENRIKFLIETKSASTTLRDRHIEQAERYAAEGNIRWVLLTNGVEWNLYHLTFEDGIEYERIYSINLSADPIEKVADCLALLHRQSIKNNEHEAFWNQRIALCPESIGKAIFNENVLRFIRRELRRHEDLLIDEEDLAKAIHELLSVEARERIGPLKIHRKRKPKTAKTPKDNQITKESASTESTNSNSEGIHEGNEKDPEKNHTSESQK